MRVTEVQAAGPVQINAASDGTLTLRIPISIRRRGARKLVVSPRDPDEPTAPIELTSFQRALVRGHRWLAMLESGAAASLLDIAKRDKVDPSLVSRLINMTTLDPEIVQAILDNVLPTAVPLLNISMALPLDWADQKTLVSGLPSWLSKGAAECVSSG
jgi:hypothetical protein